MKLNADIEDLEMPEQRAAPKEMSLEKAAKNQAQAGLEVDEDVVNEGIKSMNDNYVINEAPEGEGATQ